MLALGQLHFSDLEMIRLNCVRLHQQVLFVSDVMDVGGRALDKKYLDKQARGESWSSYQFPTQSVSNKDLRLRRNALHQLRLVRSTYLGDFATWGMGT